MLFGDWNCVLAREDRSPIPRKKDANSPHLEAFLRSRDLIDGWRENFPEAAEFTFTRLKQNNGPASPKAQLSWLDRVY
jgi:hypothetical protein